MSRKIGLQFDGWDSLFEKLDKLEGDVETIAENALEAAQAYIAPNLQKDMAKHRRTGQTEASIICGEKTRWSGTTAEIDVGFRIRKGGLASVFLMYGTPRMKKDQKLYNDIYGAKTRKDIASRQKEILNNAIQKRMGG